MGEILISVLDSANRNYASYAFALVVHTFMSLFIEEEAVTHAPQVGNNR